MQVILPELKFFLRQPEITEFVTLMFSKFIEK